MTQSAQAVELRDGSLRFDPGGPRPDVPKGYAQDPGDPWRLTLKVVPGPCPERRVTPCAQGPARWRCRREDRYTNPGICCRCQGLLEPLAG